MASLAQKLQIKPGKKWLIYNSPGGYLASLKPLPEGATCATSPRGKFDGIQVFAINNAELSSAMELIFPLLGPDTIFWVAWPKKTSGIQSDLKMEQWHELYAHGLQGVASISIDEKWAGSRFRPKGQAKISGMAKDEIRKSELAAFIDVDKKLVNLPPEMERVLRQQSKALAFYHQLSYSNKKEYVLWILMAKQEKTRTERIAKMLEKLAAGKRNPTEK